MSRRRLCIPLKGLVAGIALLTARETRAERFLYPVYGNISEFKEYRCRQEDNLGSNEQAGARTRWATACHLISEENEEQMLLSVRRGQVVPRRLVQYPTFAIDAPGFPAWVPNTDPDPTTGQLDCTVPDGVIWFAVCSAGCYAPEQRLLFGAGYVSAEDAEKQERRDIVTVAPGSTLDALAYGVGEVEAYVSDIAATLQPMLTVETARGSRLEVTTNHPLIKSDGRVESADQLEVGDALLDARGRPDPIISISGSDREVRVHNLRPRSRDPAANLVIADGLLSGSARYQSEWTTYMDRLALRSSLAAKARAE